MQQSNVQTSDLNPSQWIDRSPIQLNGLKVTLSEPVLVKRSRWYCWFPSLIRQPNGTLWALMNAYADMHISDSFCYLSRSKDGGLTWDEPRVIGDSGLNHLILPDGSTMVIPYYLRPRADGIIGAPCNIISPKGELSVNISGVTVTGWPRPLQSMDPDLATAGFVFNGQVVKGKNDEYLTTLYGHFEGDERYSLVFVESADGFAWKVRSIVAGADCLLEGIEGPCESAICRLSDGRLMCLFRLASFVPYAQTYSEDDGHTWTQPVYTSAMSVEPSLEVMPNGRLALSGGRPGISVWFNNDTQGINWQGINIVAHHNACKPHDTINPDSTKAWNDRDEMIQQGLSGFTSSYTELMRIDDKHLILIYDRLAYGWHPIPDESDETNSVWVVRIILEA